MAASPVKKLWLVASALSILPFRVLYGMRASTRAIFIALLVLVVYLAWFITAK